jgi:hypothetical protein
MAEDGRPQGVNNQGVSSLLTAVAVTYDEAADDLISWGGREDAAKYRHLANELRKLIDGCDCADPLQCWEPCGRLGHSEKYARVLSELDAWQWPKRPDPGAFFQPPRRTENGIDD